MTDDLDTEEPCDAATCDYVVGIGASAGGLAALEALVAHLPAELGVAYVVVQHLSPDFESHMVELLSRKTQLTVRSAEHGCSITPDTIFVLPPGKEMILAGDRLLLVDRAEEERLSLPIDRFLRSLSVARRRFAVAVVLSGTGSDGSRGVVDVHMEGGLTLVQSPETAAFAGMPQSALETGLVDLALPPEEIGAALRSYVVEALTPSALAAQEFTGVPSEAMEQLFEAMGRHHGLDLASYKPSTVTRRIDRRREASGAASLDEYVQRALLDREELDALHGDILIGVTRFRRDPGAFMALEREALGALFARAEERRSIRVWIAGCSTGEEAYSVAIAIAEVQRRRRTSRPVRVFATDVNERALAVAAEGLYDREALDAYDDETVARYFDAVPAGLRVKPELRRSVVFAQHDLLSQPPFTQLDLLVCRNVLIYLQPHAQKRALELFHFALRLDGFMLLGPSEALGELDDEFLTLSTRWKLFRKRRDLRAGTSALAATRVPPLVPGHAHPRRSGGPAAHVPSYHERILHAWMPPSAVVDRDFEVVHLYGGLEGELRLPRGRVSTNLLDLVDDDLRLVLSGALRQAIHSGASVRRSAVRVPWSSATHVVLGVDAVETLPQDPPCWLITFAPEAAAAGAADGEATAPSGRVEDLERDLEDTRRELQATVEELEAANEELQASNEELVASNEELQSTNEELQSVNEELYTVNAEHEQRIEQVSRERADMSNLLAATGVGVVFVDEDLRVRRFTPAIARAFDLRESDVGRPLESFAHTLDLEDLDERLAEAVERGAEFEAETSDRSGRTLLVRILPYMRDGRSRGAVLTLVDISATRAMSRRLAQFDPIVEHSPDLQVMLDREGHVVFANRAFTEAHGVPLDEVLGAPIWTIDGNWDPDHFEELFEDVHGSGAALFPSHLPDEAGGERPVDVSLSPVEIEGEALLFAHFRDVTDRELSLSYAEFARDAAVLAMEQADLTSFLELLLERAAETLDIAGAWAHELREGDGSDLVATWPPGAPAAVPEALLAAARSSPGVAWEGDGPGAGAFCAVRFWGPDQPRGVLAFRLRRPGSVRRRTFETACETAARTATMLVRRIDADRALRLRDRAMEASIDGICIADRTRPDTPIIYVNRGFELMTGYSAEESLGRNCRFLQGPETSEEARTEMREAIEEGRAHRVTILNYRKDGTPFWNDVQLSPVRDASGEVRQFVAVQHDITERMETERDLMVARRRAASASRAKSRFLATVSHEIRSPMTAIIGFTDALGRKSKDPAVLQSLSSIRRNADYLLRLIGDILDISRIEADRMEVHPEDVDLPGLLRDVTELMGVRSDQKHLPFETILEGPIPCRVRTDPTRLRQILINLLSNAIKFTEQGSVTLRVAATLGEAPRLRFQVIDTGIGIPLEDQERIFKPFVRPHTADEEAQYDGAGLGLAIVQRLVRALGGEIEVESQPGHGSTFRLGVPVEVGDGAGTCTTLEGVPRPEPRWASEATTSLAGLRVLVADDRPDVARVIEFYLEDSGASTVVVGDGAQAVEAFLHARQGADPFDVVVLDMQMPVLDGYGAAARIRAHDPGVPIIALTAGATRDDEERALAAGCTVFVAKPVDEAVLLEMVERLGARSMDGEAAE